MYNTCHTVYDVVEIARITENIIRSMSIKSIRKDDYKKMRLR